MNEAIASIPPGITNEEVAETFAAYLLGNMVFRRVTSRQTPHVYGPFQKQEGDDTRWQLDCTNNFWLHIEGSTARLISRYDSGKAMVDAMAALFTARFSQ